MVKKVVGLAEKHPELADFRHEDMSTAIGRLVQVLADAYRVTDNVVKDRVHLESVLPFSEKKNILDKKIALKKKKNQGVS